MGGGGASTIFIVGRGGYLNTQWVTQGQMQCFVYSSVASCVTVDIKHNNKQQSLQSSGCSCADTPGPCCCFWKFWSYSWQMLNNIYRCLADQKCGQPTPGLFIQLVGSSWFQQSYQISLNMYTSVCGILRDASPPVQIQSESDCKHLRRKSLWLQDRAEHEPGRQRRRVQRFGIHQKWLTAAEMWNI